MYWLVEDTEQLKRFYNSGYKQAYIEIISNNDYIHPAENDLCAVYIRPIQATKGFMLCISHSEAINVQKDWVYKILQKFDILYCKDKKQILHYFVLSNLQDVLPAPLQLDLENIPAYGIFYRKYSKLPNVNTIIPIVKHYEWCEQIFNQVKPLIQQEQTLYGKFYNQAAMVFNAIERTGIKINTELFSQHFYPTDKQFVYTQFNLNTTTTRPSNKFKGVNYAALNKKNGERKCFIPKNDKFIELDIVAYHPNIAANLINFNFSSADIHSEFATMYGVDRNEAKELTFKQLYGGVFQQYKDLPFFQQIDQFIQQKWEQFTTRGFVECDISHYRFEKDSLENMNPQKLFNYLLQNYETSNNIVILYQILKLLRGKKTEIVLYTYDSILIDYKEDENLINDIQQLFTERGLSTSKTTGYDYDFNN